MKVLKMIPDRRRRMIAKIKIAQKQLAMDDDSYRAMLQRLTGRRSCTELDDRQLERVLREMADKGFQTAKVKRPPHLSANRAMMGKLAALLAASGKTWAYADGMARRMFAKEQVSLLQADELHKLIAALNIHILKEQAKQAAAK